MPFKPVILWTDALVFLLVAGAIVFAWYVTRHEHLRAPWRKVVRNPMGMVAAVVLGAFVAVGLLDSLHYRQRLDHRAGERGHELLGRVWAAKGRYVALLIGGAPGGDDLFKGLLARLPAQ